jgi:AcrR family transcriptional regulator/L-amino acid N-acyltransferase YncA
VPPDITIRPLDDEDWAAVHDLVREVAEAGDTYAMEVPTELGETRAFWTGEHNVVATVDDVVVAAAKMGPNRERQGSHIGTASFMVGEKARGKGIGRALGEYVVDWHRRCGYRGIQFNAVVSTNTFAVRLWHSLGFRTVGLVPGAFRLPGGEYADLHVMFLSLADPAPRTSGRARMRKTDREKVLLAAGRMFADLGWSGTTLAGVAQEAGVGPEIVARFGTKGDLLIAALRRAGFGSDTDLQVAFGALRIQDEPDVDVRLDRIVDFAYDTLLGMSPLTPVLQAAAAEDETAAAIRTGAELRRLGSSRAVVGLLTRGEEPVPDAVAAVQVLTSGEVFLTLKQIGVTSPERCKAWLRSSLDRAVNGPLARA